MNIIKEKKHNKKSNLIEISINVAGNELKKKWFHGTNSTKI